MAKTIGKLEDGVVDMTKDDKKKDEGKSKSPLDHSLIAAVDLLYLSVACACALKTEYLVLPKKILNLDIESSPLTADEIKKEEIEYKNLRGSDMLRKVASSSGEWCKVTVPENEGIGHIRAWIETEWDTLTQGERQSEIKGDATVFQNNLRMAMMSAFELFEKAEKAEIKEEVEKRMKERYEKRMKELYEKYCNEAMNTTLPAHTLIN